VPLEATRSKTRIIAAKITKALTTVSISRLVCMASLTHYKLRSPISGASSSGMANPFKGQLTAATRREKAPKGDGFGWLRGTGQLLPGIGAFKAACPASVMK
jgi:hypothetical protein